MGLLCRTLVFGVLAMAATQPLALMAQDTSVRAYLTPPNGVQLGRSFLVSLEVRGAQRFDEQPTAPNLEPYASYRGSGSSVSMQSGSGQTTVVLVLQLQYQAQQVGTFEVPPISVSAGGQRHTTQPLLVPITSGPPPQGANPNAQAPPELGTAGSDLFITATPSKTSVLEGEPLIMEYRIWTRVDVNGYSVTTLPEPAGFWVEELDQAESSTEPRERDGERYTTALVRRVALVPSGSGERTIEPLEIEARVRGQSTDPFDRILGRSSQGEQITVRSNPVTITVRPLPEGRTEPFSGVVGAMDVEASLDRDTVAANDAVTLTVRVSGIGSLRTVPEPVLDLPDDFEAFPPEVATSTRRSGSGLAGTRTYEYILIPRAPGNRTIPSVTLSYYSTAAGEYRTASTGDFPLVVTGTAADGVGAVAGTRGSVTQLRRDIRFIRLGDGALRPTRNRLSDSATFWLLLLLPLTAVAASFGLRRHRDKLEVDVAYARGRRAGRVAKKRLGEASRLARGDDPRAFYAEVARALRGFVADRMNTSQAGLQTAELGRALAERGVNEVTSTELIECLDYCDRQRFAPPTSDPSERAKFLERSSALMTTLDRELKK